MLDFLRASVRLVLFFIISLTTVIFVALGNLILFSTDWSIRWKNTIIRNWAKLIASTIGLDINIKGTPPDPPFFLVCNHLSYLDVIPLWLNLNATFVAKSEIKSWPFFGWGTKTLGVLFIDRELKRDVHRLNNRISETISKEQGIIIFPEGTSSKGERVLPFNAPLLRYPADEGVPVNYATISYRSSYDRWPAHLNICWWGDMPFFSHFWELLKIPKFEADITFGEHRITGSDRKELARELHEAVSRNFSPIVKSEFKGE